MKFTIDDKTLRRVLVGVAVVIVLILIFFRVRSKYQYPNSAAKKGVVTVSSAALTTSATANSPGVVTITTTSHTYTSGDVVLFGTPATSYVVLASPAPTATTFAINASAIAPFTSGTTFKPAYTTLFDALEDCNVANQLNPNATTFDTCIGTRTTEYVASMCPWINTTPTSATASSAIVSAKATFDADILIIKNAYNGLQNSASTDLTPIVNAARRADITGATRKYLSAVCPSYYTPAAGGSAPAEYATWQGYAAAADGTVSTSIPATPPATYFDASKVGFKNATQRTAAFNRLKDWAKYATSDTAGATPLISGCTLHTAGTAPNINWKIAQQYGPGTVTTVVTLPWNSAAAGCAAPATWSVGAI